MAKSAQRTETKRQREKRVVRLMIALYCKGNHAEARAADGAREGLCEECAALADYADARCDACPFMESKTFCTNCKVHCYRPAMREQIRTVMRYSGPRMMLHHPVMAVRHLVEQRKEAKRLAAEDAGE